MNVEHCCGQGARWDPDGGVGCSTRAPQEETYSSDARAHRKLVPCRNSWSVVVPPRGRLPMGIDPPAVGIVDSEAPDGRPLCRWKGWKKAFVPPRAAVRRVDGEMEGFLVIAIRKGSSAIYT